MIPYLKEKGVGIINASALSMGLLTDQASPLHTFTFDSGSGLQMHPPPLAALVHSTTARDSTMQQCISAYAQVIP